MSIQLGFDLIIAGLAGFLISIPYLFRMSFSKKIVLYGLGIALTAFVIIRENNQNVDKISAWSTVVVALIAVLALFENINSRRDERAREDRTTNRQLVSTIKDWALRAAHSAISRQTIESHELWSARLKFKYSITEAIYTRRLAEKCFPRLVPYIDEIVSQLKNGYEVIGKPTGERFDSSKLVDVENQIKVSVEKLLQQIAEPEYFFFSS